MDQYPVPNPNVVGRMVDQEAVLVLPERGKVKVLNEVGAYIWSRVDGNQSVSEIAAQVSGAYAVSQQEAEADTLSFLEELAERGLITSFSPTAK